MTDQQNQIEKPRITALTVIKGFLNAPEIKKRFEEMLGKRAGAFMNSIINVVKNSSSLQKCTPDTIGSAAMIAASMNLPIDPALGYAAVVPYGNIAQFQIMYKGIIQLCIRSGQYQTIHNTEVYNDELKSYNPITGKVLFNDVATFKMRTEKKIENVIGFYAYFKLLSGFECEAFITTAEAIAHGKRFSKAYQYDLRDNKRTSLWSTDIVSMGKKTVLKMMLSKYGIMSIEMQDAFVAESEDFNDAWAGSEAEQCITSGVKAVAEKIKKRRGRKPKTVESTDVTPPEQPAGQSGEEEGTTAKSATDLQEHKRLYVCTDLRTPNCAGKRGFDFPKGANNDLCPHCLSKEIQETFEE